MELDLPKHLSEIGLTHNEACIYTALLSSGPTSALTLARVSGIKRPTVYNTIESLILKGLAYHEISGNKKLISAAEPLQLNKRLEKQRNVFKAVFPRLQTLYENNAPTESLIKQYPGIQGIRVVYSNLLDELHAGEDYFVISNQDKWINLDPEFFKGFIGKRTDLALNTKLLLQDSKDARACQMQQQRHESTKYLPRHVNIDINMVITSNKTIIVHLVDPIFVIVIENKSLVDMNRILFELLWGVC